MLLGRSDDIADIAARLRVWERSVAIVGAPGIGKTTVAGAAVSATGLPSRRGGALPTLSHVSYLPLKRAAGIDLAGDGTAVAAKMTAIVGAGVLVIEDLHWADEETLAALPLLARRMRMLVTARDADRSGSVGAALEECGCAVIELAPLDPNDARLLATELNGSLRGKGLEDVVRGARGNPLMIRSLAEAPAANLVDSVRARLDLLSDETRHAVETLSLLGRPADTRLVPGPVEDVLASGFVYLEREHLRIEHALIAESIAESIDDDRKISLHGEIADRLDDPAEAAVHLAAAQRYEEAYRTAVEAMAKSTQPGQRALLLKLAANNAPEETWTELQIEASKALIDAGRVKEGVEILDRVTDRGPEERATVLHHRAWALLSMGRFEEAARLAAQGLGLVGGDDSPIETRLQLRHAEAEVSEVAFGEDVARYTQLVDIARKKGVEVDRALRVAGIALMNAGEPGAQSLLTQAIQQAQVDGNLINEFLAAVELIQLFFTQKRGDHGQALALAMAWRAHSEDLGSWEVGFRVEAVLNHLITSGKYLGAVDELEILLDRDTPMGTLRPRAEGVLVACFAELGLFERARARFGILEAFAIGPRARGEVASAMTRYHWLHGDPEATIAAAVADLPKGPGRAVAQLEADWARMELGIPVAHPETDPVLEYLEPAYFERAALAAMTGSDSGDDPVEMFNAARSRWNGVWEARTVRCRLGAGLALTRMGDVAGARTSLLEAEKIAEECHYEPLLRRIRKAAREAGLSRPSRAPAAGRITAREREVLGLVATGAPTKEIAGELQIAPSTVETLIRNAMRKTGSATRLEAAAVVVSEVVADRG